MPRPGVRTDRTDCPACKARVILARGTPPLEYARGPGVHAVRHEASGAWTARVLATGEQPGPGEYRHAVHQCGEA